jgi:CelD/BcsL family acetyltransferase involved in cellulose biosynthesis
VAVAAPAIPKIEWVDDRERLAQGIATILTRVIAVPRRDEVERRHVGAALERMIRITEASYKLQGAPLADHHRGFLTEIVRRFAARRMLRLPILSIGGGDAAFILGVVERGTFYDITLAYDERFAKLSPGAFLTQRMLQGLAADGIHTVVSHGAHEYKRHWSTAFLPQERAFLFAPGLKAMATRVVRFGLQPLWKRLKAQETE